MGKAIILVGVLAACASEPPAKQSAQQYFARSTYVVMVQDCASNTSGCHQAQPETSPLAFVGLSDVDAYNYLIEHGYAGKFDDQAPLLTAHATLLPAITPTAVDVIEQWFALERAERGL